MSFKGAFRLNYYVDVCGFSKILSLNLLLKYTDVRINRSALSNISTA